MLKKKGTRKASFFAVPSSQGVTKVSPESFPMRDSTPMFVSLGKWPRDPWGNGLGKKLSSQELSGI